MARDELLGHRNKVNNCHRKLEQTLETVLLVCSIHFPLVFDMGTILANCELCHGLRKLQTLLILSFSRLGKSCCSLCCKACIA